MSSRIHLRKPHIPTKIHFQVFLLRVLNAQVESSLGNTVVAVSPGLLVGVPRTVICPDLQGRFDYTIIEVQYF